jgi:hypothetical protein
VDGLHLLVLLVLSPQCSPLLTSEIDEGMESDIRVFSSASTLGAAGRGR